MQGKGRGAGGMGWVGVGGIIANVLTLGYFFLFLTRVFGQDVLRLLAFGGRGCYRAFGSQKIIVDKKAEAELVQQNAGT